MRGAFRDHYGPWAIVTGASSGIGEAFAHALAARGINLLLVARREEELRRVGADVTAAHGITADRLALDLADPGFIDTLCTAAAGHEIGLVVGNAAYNPAGAFMDMSRDTLLRMLDVNDRANLLLAHAFLPLLRQRGHGGFLMVASVEAFTGMPYSACYSATKSFVLSLGEALWGECLGTGVDVTVLVPGATDTPLLATRAVGPKVPRMPAREAAEAGLNHLGLGPSIVPGTANRWTHRIMRRLPRAWLVRKMAPMVRDMVQQSLAKHPG